VDLLWFGCLRLGFRRRWREARRWKRFGMTQLGVVEVRWDYGKAQESDPAVYLGSYFSIINSRIEKREVRARSQRSKHM
jgi:hypothetical protein